MHTFGKKTACYLIELPIESPAMSIVTINPMYNACFENAHDKIAAAALRYLYRDSLGSKTEKQKNVKLLNQIT